MEKNSFLFDTNKCVGCMACAAGCIIENGTTIPLNWREVNTFNKIRHPQLPVFHFSLACNHCNDAPCMKNCPALAYTRDNETGAIIHHAEACIGCTYCTWACPYDAPKYNSVSHVVEKCNFCVDRIKLGMKPACAVACPVGALDFIQTELTEKDYLIPGFVDIGIKPSIKLIPLRTENTTPKIENIDAPELTLNELAELIEKPKSKVSLKKEWTLVLFTLAVAALVSWFAAGITNGVVVHPLAFGATALSAIALTSVHIGKKLRMWRFILNVRHSWLSREIFSFSAFLGLAGLFMLTQLKESAYLAILFGIISILSVDMVYQLLLRKEKQKLHSAMIWLTVILFFAWLNNNMVFIGIISLFKATIYIRRKIHYRKIQYRMLPLISLLRLGLLLVPVVIVFSSEINKTELFYLMVLIGEIIDRAEFYDEAEVITPKSKLNEEMNLQ